MYASFGQALATAQDWSPYNLVQVRIKNLESRSVNFMFIVMLKKSITDYTNAFTGRVILAPGESRLCMFHLNVDSSEPYKMEYLRPVLSEPYSDVIAGMNTRDLRTIYNWRISNQDTGTASLAISNIRLLRQNLVFDDITDYWGQYTDRDWPAKIKTDSDFAARKADELTDLANNPGTNGYAGNPFMAGPAAVGNWKTVRSPSGRMYLQHPNGNLFWSVGVSGVTVGAATQIQGRENHFKTLPSTTGSLAGAYIMRPTPDGDRLCLSFGMKNLMTKYGTNYMPSWQSMVRKRLISWGINTLGIQCADEFLDNTIPYTLIEDTDSFKTRLRTPYMLWGSMPDPYTTGFTTWMTAKFTADLAPHLAKQNFVGIFVDNEISWGDTSSLDRYYNMPRGVLNSTASQPAKTAFMNQLQAKYGTPAALNASWNTSYSSWTDFLNKQWLPRGTYTAGMKTDFSSFITKLAEKYYSQVDTALGAAGLRSLYLGSRFDDFTPEVANAAAKYVDVVSFNIYRSVENVDWNFLNGLAKPVLISELGYGTKARGTFGGPATAFSHEERAARMKAFLNKALTATNIVGVHWYSYADQPITGRWSDYENSGMGLVDVADTPYSESVKVLRDFTKTMYTVRG
jgi:hypothetical protein